VLALYEPSRSGHDAVRLAVEIAIQKRARLTVITVAVFEPTNQGCCDTRSVYWNGVIEELAANELVAVRDLVGAHPAAELRVVSARTVTRGVADEAARCGAELVVMPRPRGLVPWWRTRRVRQVQRRAGGAVVRVAPA
jgi:hypothetical protein